MTSQALEAAFRYAANTALGRALVRSLGPRRRWRAVLVYLSDPKTWLGTLGTHMVTWRMAWPLKE